MKRNALSLVTILAAAVMVVWVVGCACKIPQAELDAAKKALDDAVAAGAPKNTASSDKYASAEAMYRKCQEQANAKECDDARACALEAKRLAEEAKDLALKNPPKAAVAPTTSKEPEAAPVGLKTIYFDFDKFDIRADQRPTLTANGDYLKANANTNVVLEGHCDERGTDEYNMALGQKRADAAKLFLMSLGIEDKRLKTTSFGEEQPADPGHDEEAWAKNRRVEFKVQ